MYGVKIIVDDFEYSGMMNIGSKPTFNKNNSTLKVYGDIHIFDYNKDIKEKPLRIDVCFYVREEKSFSTVDKLVNQIKRDKREVSHRFREYYKLKAGIVGV